MITKSHFKGIYDLYEKMNRIYEAIRELLTASAAQLVASSDPVNTSAPVVTNLTTGTHQIPIGTRSYSVFNLDSTDATFGGVAIPVGTTIAQSVNSQNGLAAAIPVVHGADAGSVIIVTHAAV